MNPTTDTLFQVLAAYRMYCEFKNYRIAWMDGDATIVSCGSGEQPELHPGICEVAPTPAAGTLRSEKQFLTRGGERGFRPIVVEQALASLPSNVEVSGDHGCLRV